MVRTQHFYCQGLRFDPWLWNLDSASRVARQKQQKKANQKYCRSLSSYARSIIHDCNTHFMVTSLSLSLFSEMWFCFSLLLLLSCFRHIWLCDPIDGSPPGSPIPGILQARTLEWVAISFSNAWKGKVKVKSLSRVWLQPTRLLRPWDFPGKSTGVGCIAFSMFLTGHS